MTKLRITQIRLDVSPGIPWYSGAKDLDEFPTGHPNWGVK